MIVKADHQKGRKVLTISRNDFASERSLIRRKEVRGREDPTAQNGAENLIMIPGKSRAATTTTGTSQTEMTEAVNANPNRSLPELHLMILTGFKHSGLEQ